MSANNGSGYPAFMKKKPGYLAAIDIFNTLEFIKRVYAWEENYIITEITAVITEIPDIPNKIGLRTNQYPEEILIMSNGDVRSLANYFETDLSEQWVGKSIEISLIEREFESTPVWGMSVRGYDEAAHDAFDLNQGE